MALTKATLIDLNSNELILDLDADTSITADTDDTIHIKIAGSDELTLTSTAIAPSTSDGQALGTSSLMFSDLFLASASVINFNNGDVTLTHGSNTLVLDGGSLDINGQELILDADADTSITADTDDTIHFRIGGSDLITFTAGRIDLKNAGSRSNIKFYCESGNAHAQTLQAAPHSESASNTLTLPSTGGDVDLVSTASTATLTNKTLTTPIIAEIDNSSNITLDAGADIILDAGGGDIIFKDDGTTIATLTNSSTDLIVESANCISLPDAMSKAETSPSNLITSVEEPPSFTLNIISLSEVADSIIKSVELFVNVAKVVPPSFKIISAPSASKIISVVASSVIVEPESISAITGVVNVLFVSVAVEVVETNLASPPVPGNVRTFVAPSECGAPISVCA